MPFIPIFGGSIHLIDDAVGSGKGSPFCQGMSNKVAEDTSYHFDDTFIWISMMGRLDVV